MKLTCRKCQQAIEIPPEILRSQAPKVQCSGCGAKFRLKSRTGAPATQNIQTASDLRTQTTPSLNWPEQQTATSQPAGVASQAPKQAAPPSPERSTGQPPAAPAPPAPLLQPTPLPTPAVLTPPSQSPPSQSPPAVTAPSASASSVSVPSDATPSIAPPAVAPSLPSRAANLTPPRQTPTSPAPTSGVLPSQSSVSVDATRIDEGPTMVSTGGFGKRGKVQPMLDDGSLIAGRYRIVRFIAQGGMGEVYQAEDLELRQEVALKTVHASIGDEPAAIERFKREIALARRVTHPNVCRIFDLGQHLPQPIPGAEKPEPMTFLSMELLHGETLSQFLKRYGRLQVEEALPLIRQMTAALESAHQAHVIHRDFKSENVFLVPADGTVVSSLDRVRVVVTDFGIARGDDASDRFAAQVTGLGIVGTPAYMAPEQVENAPEITAAADIYSLGIVIYEMVTGRLPFDGGNPLTTAVKRLQEPPPPPHIHVPDLPAWWERTILRCLERKPTNRYHAVQEVSQALTTNPGPQSPRPPSFPQTPELTPTIPVSSNTFEQHVDSLRPSGEQRQAGLTPATQPANNADKPSKTKPAQPAQPAKPPRSRTAILALTLLVVAAVSGWLTWRNSRQLDPSRVQLRRSVAVLGLQNLSGRAEADWLATAITEMLSAEMAQGETLRSVANERVTAARRQLAAPPEPDFPPPSHLGPTSNVATGEAAPPFSSNPASGALENAGLGPSPETESSEAESPEIGSPDFESSESAAQSPDARGSHVDTVTTAPPLPEMTPETLARIRSLLGCDFVISGSYVSLPGEAGLRLDLKLHDAALGSSVATLSEQGSTDDLFTMVDSLSDQLRAALGAGDDGSDDTGLPRNPQAAKLYATALDHLRAFRADDARQALDQAVELEPENPMIHAALAAAWESLGFAARSSTEASRAFELSAGLPQEDRLLIEARFRESQGDWPAARRVYDQLWQSFPDELNYGLGLAAADTAAGRPVEALLTVDQLRLLPEPLGEDPRIDLAEAAAAGLAAQIERQATAAGRAVEKAEAAEAPLLSAQALVSKAQALRALGDLKKSEIAATRAIGLYRTMAQPTGRAQALAALASAQFDQSRFDEAAEGYKEAADITRQLGDRGGLASMLNNLAVVRKRQGEFARAGELYRETEQIYREVEDRRGLAVTRNNLGVLLVDRDQLTEAMSIFEGTLATWEEVGGSAGRAYALNNIGEVERLRGDLDAALGHHQEAVRIRQEGGLKLDEAVSRANLAGVYTERGNLETAREQLTQARDLAEQVGDPTALAQIFFQEGQVALYAGHLEQAVELHARALELRQEMHQMGLVTSSQIALARVALADGRVLEAEELATQARFTSQIDERPAEELYATALLVEALRVAGNSEELALLIDEAEPLLATAQQPGPRLEMTLIAARVQSERDPNVALERLELATAEAQQQGLVLHEMATRQEWITAAEKAGRLDEAKERKLALQRDAAASGLGLFAQQIEDPES